MNIKLEKIIAINADCMQIMQQYPDGYFDLAIVDPPYGRKIKDWIEKPENLCGNAWVSANADMKSDNDHCGFDLFGSADRQTHAYRTIEGVEITCGCFRGSIDEFAAKVKETHCGSEYEKQYKMIIELIKLKLQAV